MSARLMLRITAVFIVPQAVGSQDKGMPVGLSLAILLLAESPNTVTEDRRPGTQTPSRPANSTASVPPTKSETADNAKCSTGTPNGDTRAIIVCAERPQGYRINPDVMEAKRAMHSGGRPKPPENLKDNSCATVGPMGCRGGPYLDLLGAATTLATMAKMAVNGEPVGQMFVTDPQPTEYQLYLEARKRREAKEADAVAAGKRSASNAVLAQPPAGQPPEPGWQATPLPPGSSSAR